MLKTLTAQPPHGEEDKFKSSFGEIETTKDVPGEINRFDKHTVVAIKGKHHWAGIDDDGTIKIVRNDGLQVNYTQHVPDDKTRKDFLIYLGTGRVYSTGNGTYVDVAYFFLDKIDEEADYFYNLGKKSC